MQVYQAIAIALNARNNCEASGNTEWRDRWQARLDAIARDVLPSGSGVDNGTAIDGDSPADRIVLAMSFHHMDENGTYDGWTEHEIVASASLVNGFELRVTGRNRNGIKDYLADLYGAALWAEYEWPVEETATG